MYRPFHFDRPFEIFLVDDKLDALLGLKDFRLDRPERWAASLFSARQARRKERGRERRSRAITVSQHLSA